MVNKVLFGLIVVLAIGVVVVGSTDKARQQPAAAITAVSKTELKSESIGAPELQAREIVQTATDAQNLSTFVALAQALDLESVLAERGGAETYTVFAPNNSAFVQYGGGDQRVLFERYSRDELLGVLNNHIVRGAYSARELQDGLQLTTIGGTALLVSNREGKTYINDRAVVVASDTTSGTNVVHTISAVLNPSEIVQPVASDTTESAPVVSESGKTRERITCKDNGNGTVTLQDQQQSQFLGFLWWGSWHDSGSPITVASANGCKPPFPRANGEVARVSTTGDKAEATEEQSANQQKGDDSVVETGKDMPRYRVICTNMGGNPAKAEIQTQVQKPILSIFGGSWHDDGTLPVTQDGTCM